MNKHENNACPPIQLFSELISIWSLSSTSRLAWVFRLRASRYAARNQARTGSLELTVRNLRIAMSGKCSAQTSLHFDIEGTALLSTPIYSMSRVKSAYSSHLSTGSSCLVCGGQMCEIEVNEHNYVHKVNKNEKNPRSVIARERACGVRECVRVGPDMQLPVSAQALLLN